MPEERRSLSGLNCPDTLALVVGRFVIYFGYLEFQLWLWHNEFHDDQTKAEWFVDQDFKRKVGSICHWLDGLSMPTNERKALKSVLKRAVELAKWRNLVCHNPYLTIGERQDERESGRVFGIRMATINNSDPIPEASINDIEGFATEALSISEALHSGLGVFQKYLSPKR